jgi:hypothetical protein
MTAELSGLLIFMILLAGKESSLRVCLGPLLEISSSDALSEISAISRFRHNRRRVVVIGLVVDVSDALAWSFSSGARRCRSSCNALSALFIRGASMWPGPFLSMTSRSIVICSSISRRRDAVSCPLVLTVGVGSVRVMELASVSRLRRM